MKLNKMSLKWKLFLYILFFSAIVILIFCVFQILLLDKVYRSTKIKQTKSLMQEIYTTIDGSNVTAYANNNSEEVKKITNLLKDAEASVYLVKQVVMNPLLGIVEYPLIYGDGDFNTKILNVDQLNKVYQGIEKTGQPKFVVIKDDTRPEFQQVITDKVDVIENNAIIYCERVKLADNYSDYMIVMYARVTPVQPAIDTLKTQLLYITLIVIALSICIALLMSKAISKPIIELTTAASYLGEGDYENLVFNAEGYKEISELNDTLNYAVDELKKTETLNRELLANISHDLRTPLTLITGYAEMIRDFPNEDQNANVQIIIDEANRLKNLVSDLLVLSRISARTEPLNKTKFDLTALIETIITRQQKFLEVESFKLTFNFNEHVYVVADSGKIEQVIYNFISNAVNYSGESRTIEVNQIIKDKMVRIEVKDYGIGIKKEELEYVWQRYYRVDKGHQRPTQGSGLGLSIIKGILDYHEFKYGVTSVENKGSTFWFEAPIAK